MSVDSYVMIVGVDFGKLSDRAFEIGYQMAAKHPAAEVHVVSVVREAADAYNETESGGETLPRVNLELAARQLASHVSALRAQVKASETPHVKITSHVMFDVPVIGITNLARELEADLIVVGTHGRRGLARWLLGSVAEGIIRYASCPVFVVPPLVQPGPLPTIEAPCPSCVQARAASGGVELWCDEHRTRDGRLHTHHS
jgi:nucleotide-binding universal stress UspA family protein